MEQSAAISGYKYCNSGLNGSHNELVPSLLSILSSYESSNAGRRLIDVGCGNGSVAELLHRRGYSVIGVDPSDEGTRIAHTQYPHLQIDQGSAYEDLAKKYGKFDVVVSLEVVEHVYSPRVYAATVFSLLNEGGIAIISTPYHGYIKNLALAVSGKFDKHFTALWDHGHIKFWSIASLTTLLNEAGFTDVRFRRVGRIPPLAKSMIAVGRK